MEKAESIHIIILDPPSADAESARERDIAIADLLEENKFIPVNCPPGPYVLHLEVIENRLRFDVRDTENGALSRFNLPLSSLRSLIKDYFVVCDSYVDALKTPNQHRLEAIDMGRRGLHNEGAEILSDRLKAFVEMDFDTARRLFTLISLLQTRWEKS